MTNTDNLIKKLVDKKAEQNNRIDLNAYELGLIDLAKAINFIPCCTELCQVASRTKKE